MQSNFHQSYLELPETKNLTKLPPKTYLLKDIVATFSLADATPYLLITIYTTRNNDSSILHETIMAMLI